MSDFELGLVFGSLIGATAILVVQLAVDALLRRL